MKIVLLGSGNVATHLGIALRNAGHEILQVWSRNKENASVLAELLSCPATAELGDLTDEAEIYIISVVDDAISYLVSAFPFPDKLLIHTSGTTDLDVLNNASNKTGVFYPLQTFSKKKNVDFQAIPIAVEGKTEVVEQTLAALAKTISRNVAVLNSEKRKVLHVAAVFACNFSNHLYSIASDLLQENGLGFDFLRPLILETASKIKELSPFDAQTGPAVRGDGQTIQKHLDFLKGRDELREIYTLLSQNIINLHEKHQ